MKNKMLGMLSLLATTFVALPAFAQEADGANTYGLMGVGLAIAIAAFGGSTGAVMLLSSSPMASHSRSRSSGSTTTRTLSGRLPSPRSSAS